ncbi:hypothetical protein SCALIN_C15_0061 [Candidatus Scalindua japonica]|uniref:Uncharacterized protein n=1 Tax=Candidatus Scalindua japonica TaxID=1284222 RepID=A0A286TYD7_9BACT|nr:hypothetical protein SCALIN_C15_0061 [Candidatus Scalindua japonica]
MIKHTIRSKDGKTKAVPLTSLKAIRYHCLECVCGSANEVEHCTGKLCSLYPYRFGKSPRHKGKGNVKNLNKK